MIAKSILSPVPPPVSAEKPTKPLSIKTKQVLNLKKINASPTRLKQEVIPEEPEMEDSRLATKSRGFKNSVSKS